MNFNKILLCILFTTLTANAFALEYELELNAGFDSNPFELAETFEIEADQFIEVDARFKQAIADGLRASVKLHNQSYLDLSDADSLNTAVKLDYYRKAQLMERDVRYRFDVEYNTADSTYVSKNLGRIGENSIGEPIADRYDANWLDYRARVDFELSESLRLDLNIIGRSKNYADLTNFNLSSLDYTQWLFEPELRYTSDDKNLLTAKFTTGNRSYDNRNGRDLQGIFVPISELEYDFLGFKVGWRYRPSESQQLRVSYSYEAREDNVAGYFDATDNLLSLRYTNRISDKQELRLGMSYKDFSYDNNVDVVESETEEAINTKEGFNLSASYGYLWSESSYGDWWLNTSLGYENYDSVSAAYVYDKALFTVGIKLEL